MQFLVAAATALLAGLAAAAPSDASAPKARQAGTVTLTFWAAADVIYTLPGIPTDGTHVLVDSNLSFTYISSDAPNGVACQATGVDDSHTVLYGASKNVPIGPPQEQVEAWCYYY